LKIEKYKSTIRYLRDNGLEMCHLLWETLETSFRKKETENEFVSSKRNRNSEEDVYIIWTKRKYEQNLSVS